MVALLLMDACPLNFAFDLYVAFDLLGGRVEVTITLGVACGLYFGRSDNISSKWRTSVRVRLLAFCLDRAKYVWIDLLAMVGRLLV